MQHNLEEDSGRSSCSAASIGLSPIIDYHHHHHLEEAPHHQEHKRLVSSAQDSTKTELKVSSRPRSYTSLLKSPDERDPFPSCRLPPNRKNVLFNIFNHHRLGGLSSAHSTMNIACSTQIEQPDIPSNAVSMSALTTQPEKMLKGRSESVNPNVKRGKPVQRAASRLYKAEPRGKDGCVGPEFIVRASQPPKQMDLTLSSLAEKKKVNVHLLNGQRMEIICDPSTATAGYLFEAIVRSEKYEHNFMLGMAVLIEGDFVFLPDDYKLKKVAPEGWHKNNKKSKTVDDEIVLTVFLRIKFFLPKNIASNIQGGEWRYRVYLQLRRATVEGQMTSTLQNLILLAGYALHIEFGEFSYREHGTADYFLMEHYLPETIITNDMADVKLRMKKVHESRQGLDRNRAIINYITLAQTFRDYGAHFYSAIWATRDGFCRDVWLSIGPRGVTLYSRNNHSCNDAGTSSNRIVLQSLPWHHIHTFYYNKKNIYILPNSHSGLSKIGLKYKLKMTDNKSYFTFWLASLHHRLYLRLYAKEDFLNYLSEEMNCPTSPESPEMKYDCSNYQDSYNLAVRNPARMRRPVRRRFRVDIFGDKKAQNKENEKPSTEKLLQQLLTPQQSDDSLLQSPPANRQANSSNDAVSSSESCSLPRRRGVKMGTKVFNGMKSGIQARTFRSPTKISYNDRFKSEGDLPTTQSDSDDLSCEQSKINSMKLLPERQYNPSNSPTAFVLESPKVYPEVFSYNAINNESCLNSSIFEKLDNMECVQGERIFVTAILERDETNALGLQVAEGSDGNVYVKSITPGSPAELNKKLLPGDQIISVNGQTLLNMKYDKALAKLQSAPKHVELIVLQNINRNSEYLDTKKPDGDEEIKKNVLKNLELSKSVASALDIDIADDELLNEEALKTIYALIKITKEKVISRMKDRNTRLSNPNGGNLQKCFSENKVYEESDFGNFSSQDTTPSKKYSQKFNSWRGQLTESSQKRRPLSLSIPTDVDLSGDYLNDASFLLNNPSLKSIQSSLSGLDNNSVKSTAAAPKNVALPRSFAPSRRWLGPVRYPVTPCKNNDPSEKSAINKDKVIKKHFVYGARDSDEEQIFL